MSVGSSRIRLAVFDIDGTLTRERNAWEFVHRDLGIWENKAVKYQDMYIAGEIDYDEFARLDALCWQGISRKDFAGIVGKIQYREHVREILDAVKAEGARVVLVSTGLGFLAQRIVQEFGLDSYYANDLELDSDERLTGRPFINVSCDDPSRGKGAVLRMLMAKEGLEGSEVMAVGDSYGDIELFRLAGLSVLVDPTPEDRERVEAEVPGIAVVETLPQILNLLPTSRTL